MTQVSHFTHSSYDAIWQRNVKAECVNEKLYGIDRWMGLWQYWPATEGLEEASSKAVNKRPSVHGVWAKSAKTLAG